MAQTEIPNSLKRILAVTLVFMFVSAVVVVVMGESIKQIYKETYMLDEFLEESEDIQPNFEKSLEVYTGEATEITNFLSDLRPDTEEELVDAISSIEDAARKSGLNISLKSTESTESIDGEESEGSSIDYNVSFYGSMTDMQNFLTELESLSLYIKIEEIDFKDTKFLNEKDLEKAKNINLKIKLYTK